MLMNSIQQESDHAAYEFKNMGDATRLEIKGKVFGVGHSELFRELMVHILYFKNLAYNNYHI
jgi:hypothetical protein